ncbi:MULTISPECIES: hypothetical protein [Mycobacteriaceae]|uniref:Helix-turn-helix domain-containing protein n=1 Tax=Mycolicibacter heraklionensis TaxID=512402 RepID=A0A9X7WGY7_9MYCO|nr:MULTISPECIES: hypothetical protein [Mycobacteriaceae]KLO30565.1 hypothetical protein ABW16_06585 [Mycolicibacter heraklionensis]QZA07045.1 hypothetical protein K3U94_19075 [Mycolicibacter heraklionensis]
MSDTQCNIISRQVLLEWLGVSDSTERRKRKEGRSWPPHLMIAGKVCYRRSAVEDFIRAQEAICQKVISEAHGKASAVPEGQVRHAPRAEGIDSGAVRSAEVIG